MDYSDEFVAGWTAARTHAQRTGSVPPYPPGYGADVPAESPEPPPPPADPIGSDEGDGSDEDEE